MLIYFLIFIFIEISLFVVIEDILNFVELRIFVG